MDSGLIYTLLMSTIIVIVRYHAEIVLEILVMDRSSAASGTGRKMRRRSTAPACHDLQR